jgi:CxxC motif-containing protein (DUF1111 family)
MSALSGSNRERKARTAPRAALAILLSAPLLFACSSNDESPNDALPADPAEQFPGGATTNTLLLGANAFIKAASNITEEHEGLFYSGNSFFNQGWVQAPASTELRDGLGPLFNARSCSACHFKDGRGSPPLAENEDFIALLLRLSVPGEGEHGEPVPEPNYGGQLQPFAIADVTREGSPRVTYEAVPGNYADGESYELLAPTYSVEDLRHGDFAEGTMISPRVAPAMSGLGLLQAIPLERLEELADPHDANGDGVSGRINWVWDASQEAKAVGRFGWKAEQPTVRQQSAGALSGDLGITSSLFSQQDCTASEADCSEAPSGGSPEIADETLDRLELYGMLLAVPVRERWNDERTLAGKTLFTETGCASCHVERHTTDRIEGFPELTEQTIFPYTDLLLHDLGDELGDGRPSFDAEGNEWRTPPLWGLRYYEIVNGHDRLLHDGRARGVAEAILWHGGEAEASREAFRSLSRDERELLVDFVESL